MIAESVKIVKQIQKRVHLGFTGLYPWKIMTLKVKMTLVREVIFHIKYS